MWSLLFWDITLLVLLLEETAYSRIDHRSRIFGQKTLSLFDILLPLESKETVCVIVNSRPHLKLSVLPREMWDIVACCGVQIFFTSCSRSTRFAISIFMER